MRELNSSEVAMISGASGDELRAAICTKMHSLRVPMKGCAPVSQAVPIGSGAIVIPAGMPAADSAGLGQATSAFGETGGFA